MKLLKTAVASLFAIVPFIAIPVLASEQYTFNRYIGDVWVGEATVSSDSGYTRVDLYMSMPTCDSSSQLDGDVTISYYSDDGGYLENHSIFPYEGDSGWYYISGNVRMSENGTIYITDNLYCEPLGWLY